MTGHYKSNVRDVLFNLLEWSPTRDRFGVGLYEDFDEQTVRDIINEVAAFAEGRWPTASRHSTAMYPCWT